LDSQIFIHQPFYRIYTAKCTRRKAMSRGARRSRWPRLHYAR